MQQLRSRHLTLRDAKSVGLRWSPGIVIKCGNLRRPWWKAFGPHSASPSSLLPGEYRCITQASCSSHGVKMGHLINGNHFHPSTLREGIIVFYFFLFSFPPGGGVGEERVVEVGNIKHFTLYFLTSPGAQAPFEDGTLCNETFTSNGFQVAMPPMPGGTFC